MVSLGDRWKSANGRPAGFDFLRITLSISVILWHSVAICNGLAAERWFYTGPLKPLVWFVVPAFFALSGFLVAGSLERNSLTSFISLRAIRIFPALSAEVIISALLIGPLFTHPTLRQYFTDPTFYRYFLNALGDIHYTLPGVFTDLPVPNLVNSQLWTVPYELDCYLTIAAAAIIGLTKRRRAFMLAVLAIVVALALRDVFGGKPGSIAQPPGRMLILAFLCGVALYLNQSRIAYSRWLFVISTAAFALSLYASNRAGEDFASVFVAYVTVYIGLLEFRMGLIGQLADYSYGIYLYGFPIQQMTSELLPGHRVWYINFAISLTVTFVFAIASWHLLESKVMARKKPVLTFVSHHADKARRYAAQLRETIRRRFAPANPTAGAG